MVVAGIREPCYWGPAKIDPVDPLRMNLRSTAGIVLFFDAEFLPDKMALNVVNTQGHPGNHFTHSVSAESAVQQHKQPETAVPDERVPAKFRRDT